MPRLLLLMLVSLVAAACATEFPDQLVYPDQTEYTEGQVWRYQTRAGEEDSLLYISRIDQNLWDRPIYHLYVDGLKIQNRVFPGGSQDYLPHIPVDGKTLDSSVTDLVSFLPNPPDISSGYDYWRAEFDYGSAGVFTIPVGAIIQVIEDGLAQSDIR